MNGLYVISDTASLAFPLLYKALVILDITHSLLPFTSLYIHTAASLFHCFYYSFLVHHPHLPMDSHRSQLHRQLALTRQSLFDQGFLDEQFVQLEELQDDANPNFVEEIVTLYYRDSARLIHNIESALEKNPLDFNKLDGYMHQFKGSSSSIGAKKVKAECTLFREYCKAGNGEGCLRTFQQIKKEYATLKRKLEAYFQQARQAGPAQTACRRK